MHNRSYSEDCLFMIVLYVFRDQKEHQGSWVHRVKGGSQASPVYLVSKVSQVLQVSRYTVAQKVPYDMPY